MSPEQARGEPVDVRSDLFSLGMVLYECIAGSRPFSGATAMDIRDQILSIDPLPPSQINPDAPPGLDPVIIKALAKALASRYQSASDMLGDLRAMHDVLQSGRQDSNKPLARQLGASVVKGLTILRDSGRHPRVLIPMALLVLAVAGLAFFGLLPGVSATPHQPSPDALRWYNLGINYLHNGAYHDASLILQRAIDTDDNFPLAHARLAEAWSELGYNDKAQEEILRGRSLIPDISALPRLERHYLEAITHRVLLKYGSAIESYQRIAREAPDAEKAQAYLDLGRAYEKNNEVEKAIESLKKATELAPTYPAAFLRLGVLYGEREQDLERAFEAFEKADDSYWAIRNFEGVTEVYYQRGSLFYNLDRFPEARAQLEKVLEIVKTTDNHYQQIKALSLLSNVSVAQRQVSLAKEQANQAIETARARGIDNQVASGLIYLGHIYLIIGEHVDAEKHYKEALELAQRDKDRLNEAWAHRSLGSLRSLQRNTDEALMYLEPARIFFEQCGYRKWLALSLALIGRVQRDRGDYEEAQKTFNNLLERGEQANDQSQVALAREEIGSVFAAQELFPEALDHYDKGYEINRTLNAQFNLGYTAMHRGDMLWQLGRYDEARAAVDEALAIANSPDGNYEHLLASIYVVEARMKLSRRRFPETKARCRDALDLAGTQFSGTIVQAKYILGLMNSRSGSPRLGITLCNQAVKEATEIGDPQMLSGALLASAEAMLEAGQAKRALQIALEAQASFARHGQQDSQWRAWLVAARANSLLGEREKARDDALNARARLSDLEQRWGAEAYSIYSSRPDVQHFRNQLDQILKTQL
jgi:tetratricopeptide (TPR) repeat protein